MPRDQRRVVSSGCHSWVAPLVRQLVGDGVVTAIVTAEDAPGTDLFRAALAELGARPAVRGVRGFVGELQVANAAGVATISVGAVDSEGAGILHRIADCRQIHDSWRDNPSHPDRCLAFRAHTGVHILARVSSTRSRDASKTRADILAAARARFGSEGYQATRCARWPPMWASTRR